MWRNRIFGGMLHEEKDGDGGGAGGSGGGSGGDGSGGDGGEGGGTGDKGKPATVSKADHDRALADLQKFKKEAAQLKADKKAAEDAKLKETNDYKTLAEQREAELTEIRTENERIKSAIVAEKKFNTVAEECRKLGLLPGAASDLEMLDLDAVQVETTSTGKTNILGADKFAARLKAAKPHWFGGKSTSHVNTGKPGVLEDADGAITIDQLVELEKDAKKTGDKSKYTAAFNKYQQQRAKAQRH